MNFTRRRTANALLALCAATITLAVPAAAQADPGDITQTTSSGSITEQPVGTFLLSGGWEAEVDVTGYTGPFSFRRNTVIARDNTGTDYESDDNGAACTSTLNVAETVATVSCDGTVTVPSADRDYTVTALLVARDGARRLIGTDTLLHQWTAPTTNPDPVDDGDDPGTGPACEPQHTLIAVCVNGISNVPVTCVDSLRQERWVPGTGVAEFEGGRKQNGDLWRDQPLKVEGGHKVLIDKTYAHQPGTSGDACNDNAQPVLQGFAHDTRNGMPYLWDGTPPEGGFSKWEGPTNGYRLGNYGYASTVTLVTCRTFNNTDVIADCATPFVANSEVEKVTLACDGPRYGTGGNRFAGWREVAPRLLTAAGCETPDEPKTETPDPDPETPDPTPVPDDPEVPQPDDPRTPPRIDAGATYPVTAGTQGHSSVYAGLAGWRASYSLLLGPAKPSHDAATDDEHAR